MSSDAFEFDVALSFAGEDRSFVEKVAKVLRDANIRVFYDEYFTTEMWGEDLYVYLDAVYQTRSKFVAIFVSHAYAAKPWTNHERQSAQARALKERSAYILPIRLDNADIPGLRPTIAHLDAQGMSGEQVAAMIMQKLGQSAEGLVIPRPPIRAVPRTAEQLRELTATRPVGWEQLLFGAIMLKGIEERERDFRDNEIGYAPSSGLYVSDADEVTSFLQRKSQEGLLILSNGRRLFTPQVKERAFGPLGEPGDPNLIIHLGERLVSVYADLLYWAAEIRGTSRPSEYDIAFELAAKMVDSSIRTLRKVVYDFVAEMDTMPDRLEKGEDVAIRMIIDLDIPDEITQAYNREMKRLNRRHRHR
jgi:hypothetical protein